MLTVVHVCVYFFSFCILREVPGISVINVMIVDCARASATWFHVERVIFHSTVLTGSAQN